MTKTNLAGAITVAAEDIRDIRPPVSITSPWEYVLWTLAIVVPLAMAFLFWTLWRRKKLKPAPAVIIPPHVRAKQRLAEALLLISDPDRFCTAVSGTLRVYLEERFQLHAPERTTEEFLIELQTSPALTSEQKGSLRQFLESCDLVKFARFEPTETALRDLHESALRLVDETQFDPVVASSSSSSPAGSAGTPPPLPPSVPPAVPQPPPVPAPSPGSGA